MNAKKSIEYEVIIESYGLCNFYFFLK